MAAHEPAPSGHPAAAAAIQELLDTHPIREKLYYLALQVLHNLQHQHQWTDLVVQTHSAVTGTPMPRPLVTGLPPQRLYIHPDEQIALLQQQKQAGKTGLPELESEREWVLPSHLREKWSLRRFGEVFDAIGVEPPAEGVMATEQQDGTGFDGVARPHTHAQTVDHADGGPLTDPEEGGIVSNRPENKWRTTKRVLLATLDNDSTIVYYIVHDGIVKPRQN